jgi:hypothetical protein
VKGLRREKRFWVEPKRGNEMLRWMSKRRKSFLP